MYFSRICLLVCGDYHAQRDTARTGSDQCSATQGSALFSEARSVRVAECLAHLKLLTLGHSARVVAVHGSHVSQQALRSGKREVLPRTAQDLTYKIAAVAAVRPLSPVRADRRAAAFEALLPQPRMFADRRAAAVTTGAAVARARRSTRRRSRSAEPASAHAGTSSQAGAQAPLLNTLGVFLHVPASGDANERARREAAV